VREFLVVSFEALLNQWVIMSSKLFFVQIKENLHLFLAESCGAGSGCSCWLKQRQLIAVPFHTTFEPVLACRFFGD